MFLTLTQTIYKKTKNKENMLNLQCSILKSTVEQYHCWHTGAGNEGPGKKSYWLEAEEEGKAEGSEATGDRGQAAASLTPDVDGTGSDSLLDSSLSLP